MTFFYINITITPLILNFSKYSDCLIYLAIKIADEQKLMTEKTVLIVKIYTIIRNSI